MARSCLHCDEPPTRSYGLCDPCADAFHEDALGGARCSDPAVYRRIAAIFWPPSKRAAS